VVYDKRTGKTFTTSPDGAFFENDLNTVELPNGELSDFLEQLYTHLENQSWKCLNKYYRCLTTFISPYQIGTRSVFHTFVETRDGGRTRLDLMQIGDIPIKRHVKVQTGATPYDPRYADYFKQRWCVQSNRRKADRRHIAKFPCNLSMLTWKRRSTSRVISIFTPTTPTCWSVRSATERRS